MCFYLLVKGYIIIIGCKMVAPVRETLDITLLYQGFGSFLQLFPFNSRFLPVSPRIPTFKDKKASFGGVIGGVALN